MIDEKDMSKEMRWHAEKLAERAIKALERDRLEAEYVPNRKEALEHVLGLIPSGATIGCGDSVTLHQIGFFDWLKMQKDHEVFNPFLVDRSNTPDDSSYKSARFNMTRKALTANVFLSGTNAITLNGELVNLDGNGNRVAAMIFGPNRVIVVAGYNKIVRDVDEAMKKLQEYTAPMNMRRHYEKHNPIAFEKYPCVTAGTCLHCHAKTKACLNLTIISGWSTEAKAPGQYPTHIIIVGEPLGI
jgi:hypothetical protein